jgi:hypothetical protein
MQAVTGQRKIPKELQHLNEDFLAQQSDITLRALAKMIKANHRQPASESAHTGKIS